MLYSIETITEIEAGETKTTYRLWIKQERKSNVICYFDSTVKPVVDVDTIIVRGADKVKDFETLYFSLHYGDIVEDKS